MFDTRGGVITMEMPEIIMIIIVGLKLRWAVRVMVEEMGGK